MAILNNFYRTRSHQVQLDSNCDLVIFFTNSQSSEEFHGMLEKLVSATKYNEKQCKIVAFDHLSFDHIEFLSTTDKRRFYLIFDDNADSLLPNVTLQKFQWVMIADQHYLLAAEPSKIVGDNSLKKKLWEAMKLKLV